MVYVVDTPKSGDVAIRTSKNITYLHSMSCLKFIKTSPLRFIFAISLIMSSGVDSLSNNVHSMDETSEVLSPWLNRVRKRNIEHF
jgi:hypothetical protein